MGCEAASIAEKTQVFRSVIYGYTFITAVMGIYIWFAFKSSVHNESTLGKYESNPGKNWRPLFVNIKKVFSFPSIWLQALIVLCAYVGYKGFDHYTLFAVDVYGYDEIEAATLLTLGSWSRPFAAIAAGLLVDRFHVVKMVSICFILLLASDLYFAFATPMLDFAWIFIGNVLITCIAIFAIRGLYFAIYEEVKMPLTMTGTAVGMVSVIGFTPDIFILFVAGWLMDQTPGLQGHQHYFMFLFFCCIGFGKQYIIIALCNSKVTADIDRLNYLSNYL